MTKLLEILEKLTEDQQREVQDFAEFLLAKRTEPGQPQPAGEAPHKISFEGWEGCLAHAHPEMSDKEFKKLIEDERIREAMND